MQLNKYGVAFTLMFSACTTNALAQSSSVCDTLASKLTPDISTQTSVSTRELFYWRFIQDDRFQSYDDARSTQLDIGVNVVDYVDFTLGTKSDDKTWLTNWSKFRSSSTFSMSSSSNISVLTSHWNPQVLQALLSNCKPTVFYAQITSVDPDYSGFTVAIHGIGQWQLKAIKPTGKSDKIASVTCNETLPSDKFNTAALSCGKDPDKTVTLTISTSLGDSDPLTIYSRADALYNQLIDVNNNETAAIRNELAQQKLEIGILNHKIQA